MTEQTTQQRDKALGQFLLDLSSISEGEHPGLEFESNLTSLRHVLSSFPHDQQLC